MSQVLSDCPRSNHRAVLLFKDSKSGTSVPGGTKSSNDFEKRAPVKKQTQYPYRPRGFAPQQKSGPAISEAAEHSRCHAQRDPATHKSRWSKAQPR